MSIHNSIDPWQPIETVSHDDGNRVLLWADGARVNVWEWDDLHSRWELPGSDDPVYWPEGDLGPEYWMPMPSPPAFAALVSASHFEAA